MASYHDSDRDGNWCNEPFWVQTPSWLSSYHPSQIIPVDCMEKDNQFHANETFRYVKCTLLTHPHHPHVNLSFSIPWLWLKTSLGIWHRNYIQWYFLQVCELPDRGRWLLILDNSMLDPGVILEIKGVTKWVKINLNISTNLFNQTDL